MSCGYFAPTDESEWMWCGESGALSRYKVEADLSVLSSPHWRIDLKDTKASSHIETFIAQHELDSLVEIQRGIADRIEQLKELLGNGLASSTRTRQASAQASPTDVPKKRTMSAAARKRIAEAQRRRWAKQKSGK